ncbi:MAG: aspartate--tRNA(Asn) ligase [Treponema sp.]|jgi:nondiscriminating aspartyl-tRNA synthetase|nr:aspartate--tRNA(Asn) ligase [Treponema sp.]
MKELDFSHSLSSLIDFDSLLNRQVTLTGQIQNISELAWGGFIHLRLPNYVIQCVIDREKSKISFDGLRNESAVKITGTVVTSTIKNPNLWPRNVEVQVSAIDILAASETPELPVDISKKVLNCDLNTKFNYRPLTLRHPGQRAVFRIASCIYNEFGNFLNSIGFTRICSPKIVSGSAEGGANVFKLPYFDREAFLAQSPQFYKQMMVGVFGRVYEEAPVFRAEEHNTSRHLNEYISLDFEMVLENGFEDIIQVETAALNNIFAKLKETCRPEINLLGIEIPEIKKIVTVKFAEVHEIVFKETGRDFRDQNDLDPEEERLICDYSQKHWSSDFVFVTHYPASKRPFYALNDPGNPEETCSFDLLFRGIEITTGGARMHIYADYVKKMERRGMNVESFESFLQIFRYGMPPHGGLGLGLERLTAQLCGLANVKEASLFPRDMHRLEP